VFTESPTSDHDRRQLGGRGGGDPKFDLSIVEQKAVANPGGLEEVDEGRVDKSRTSLTVTSEDAKFSAALQRDWQPSRKAPSTNFWAAEILHHGCAEARTTTRVSNELEDRAMGFVRSVGEVQPEQVNASHQQRIDSLGSIGRWSGRGNDLCMTHYLLRGASPLGLPDTLSREPLRRLAPFAWLASLRSLASSSNRFLTWLPSLRSLASSLDRRAPAPA